MCMAAFDSPHRVAMCQNGGFAGENPYRFPTSHSHTWDALMSLVTVSVDVSDVVEAPVQRVWQILSYFGDTHGYQVTVGSSNLPSASEVCLLHCYQCCEH
jgi:hypothetical protein